MKILKLLAPLLISGLFAMQSHATTANYTEQWTAASGKAGIYYSSDYDDMPKYFMAHIAHAKSGEQRLYFLDQYIQDKNICKIKLLRHLYYGLWIPILKDINF